MSTTLAFRLILGLLVGGVLTFSVWDRNDRELKEQPADEDTRTGMPRFRSFAAVETLPTMLVMYLAISLAICDELERFAAGKTFTTHASIKAKLFFQHRGYHVVRKQEVIRHGVALTNFVMEKQPGRTK